jgi:acyl-CoA synthetase (AMP-forming)/AMP-acid ligase II/acyl carrier protein
VDRGRSLTYGEWDSLSNAAGRGLADRGVVKGDLVALAFDNTDWVDYAVAYLAVHKAGAAAVPMTPGLTDLERARILGHSQAAAVICSPTVDSPARDGAGPWTVSVAELVKDQRETPVQVPMGASDLAEVIYTSGTTGTPKGVACSHASIVVHDGPPEPEGPRETLLHAFPIGTNASQEVLRITLRRSDRLAVALQGFDPERAALAIEEHRVSRLQLGPAMAQALVASGAWRGRDLASVEVVILSSAPTAAALLDRLAEVMPRARLANTYALTEAGGARTLNPDARARPDSVGPPVGRTEVAVMDETDRPVQPGDVGEVWLRRPGTPPRAYFRDPDATATAFVGDWVRTGDLGWLDGNGWLQLVDRKKDLVISGGLNISSIEVEGALYEHPDVVEAAVFGLPHEVLGQQVAAAVVASAPVDVRQLQGFVRDRLAEHKVPRRIAVMDRLPRTTSGKIRKAELAAELGGDGSAQAGHTPTVALTTATEEAIAAIWTEVLGVEVAGADDDFFERGGDSLAAARVLARVEDSLGVRLPMEELFERPTVAELAAAVAGA